MKFSSSKRDIKPINAYTIVMSGLPPILGDFMVNPIFLKIW